MMLWKLWLGGCDLLKVIPLVSGINTEIRALTTPVWCCVEEETQKMSSPFSGSNKESLSEESECWVGFHKRGKSKESENEAVRGGGEGDLDAGKGLWRIISWAPELGQWFLTWAALHNHLGSFLNLTCCSPTPRDSKSVDLRWLSVLFLYLYVLFWCIASAANH